MLPEVLGRYINGSIARLEKVLAIWGVPGYDEHIRFLRSLQNLRSSGMAHRKGSNYQKVAREFGVESHTLRQVFHGILARGILFLQFLNEVDKSGKLDRNLDEGPSKKPP